MGLATKKAVSKSRADQKAKEARPSTKKSPAATGSTASRPPANRTVPAAPVRDRAKGEKCDGPQGAGTGGVDAGGSSSRSRIRSKGSPSMEDNYDDFYDDTTLLQQGIGSDQEEGKEEGDFNPTANRKRSHQQHHLGSTWPSRPTSPLPDGPPLVDAADTDQPRKRPAIGIAGKPTEYKSTADEEEEVRWSEQLHRELVDAIYEIGVSHASPSVIIENMVLLTDVASSTAGNANPNQNPVTSERVKSHLQKYRKNKTKSREEFLQEYDLWMQKALTMVGGVSAAARTSLVTTPTAVIEMVGGRRNKATNDSSSIHSNVNRNANEAYKTRNLVLGGALPAFLTYSIMLEDEHALIMRQRKAPSATGLVSSSRTNVANTKQPHSPRSAAGVSENTSATVMGHLPSSVSASMPSASEYTQYYSGTRISIPALTDEERKSSLGVSISHVVGLFHSITHHLMKERDAAPSSERPE